jgi:hypothetical protein
VYCISLHPSLLTVDDFCSKLDAILPEDFSASYRRLVKRDFSLDVDDYSIANATDEERKANESLFGVISRINMTRDSMDDDEDAILPTNFTRIGCILIDFICGLSKAMVSNVATISR